MMRILLIGLICLTLTSCADQENEQLILFDPGEKGIGKMVSLTDDPLHFDDQHIRVDFSLGNETSIIACYPDKGPWDASAYRFVRCNVENLGSEPQIVEIGFADYDLTLGATIVQPGETNTLKAVIYRTEHPAYIDSLFPVMHGKPDGTLRGWMDSTSDSVAFIKLLFPELKPGASVKIGKIWLEEPYVLYTESQLREKYYPFVDRFGQFMYDQWPGKIESVDDLTRYDAMETNELENMEPVIAWNRFGGWETGPTLEATGRFRVEKIDGRWWFVDPDGKLFWSHGQDCVEFGTQTRTRITNREHYFQELPSEGSEEAGLYTTSEFDGNTTRFLSFHALNIFRKYGEDWKDKSRERLHARFKNWGFNTIGNWSDPGIYLKRKTPYVLTAYSLKTGMLSDPYSPGFQEELEATLRARKEEIGDPWCLGVFVDNELKWGVKWGPKIAEQIITAPADQPAKLVLAERMRVKYGTIDGLNEAWGTVFGGWDGLLNNVELIPGAADDMREFMTEFTTRYYASCKSAVKAVDDKMLYLGCRMDFHLYPEDTSLNYIIRIASKYCDVVSFNRYRYTCSELVPPDGGDYPIIIGEFHFGSLETGLLQPGLRYAADNQERAAFYDHYVHSALLNPYIVGTHWFQLVDQSVTGRPDGENYQAGFLTVGDVPQQEIITVSRVLGYKMYDIRSGVDH
ncbi:MAG: hypothetical protein WD578_13045 [Bacteroidales bacterium]